MRLSGLRLTDLSDQTVLRELVGEPEGERLERKREADAPTLVKAISGMANANGGWLLLGIEDDGSLYKLAPKGRAHLRDWLRDKLDGRLDPMPSFAAELFVLDGTTIGVVQVPRSSQAPHFVEQTGEVWERRNGQTRRASPQRVQEMMKRASGQDRTAAMTRLDDRFVCRDVAERLDAPRAGTAMHGRALASIVRISLLETSEPLAGWVHSDEALKTTDAFLVGAAQTLNGRGLDWFEPPRVDRSRTTAGGHVGSAKWDGRILGEVAAGFDGAGLAGVRFAGQRPDDSGIYYLLSNEVRDQWVEVALAFLLRGLEHAGAFGPAIVRWDLHGVRAADVTTVRDDRVVLAQGVIPQRHHNMVAIDIDVDLGATAPNEAAAELWRRLERLAGSRRTGADT
jgi:hypothetical protein